MCGRNDRIWEEFGSKMRWKLRELIDQHNEKFPKDKLSQAKLSRVTGISKNAIGKMCNGSQTLAYLETLDRLKDFFGVGIEKILE